ncbi:MAG: hypothetical protein C5B60_05095 [Chloroflexi bacterium]|nr:MAG: hypothetical protein C5B60_05095 [Chloroflexota bacterium]
MNIQTVVQHFHGRVWLKAAIAALALGVAILPLTANAASDLQSQASACNGSLTCLISWGDARIAERLTALRILSGKVKDRQSDHSITSDQAATLQADATTNTNNLTALKAKIDADTEPRRALADDKSIFVTYRIFAAVLPHDYRLLWFDVMQNLESKMRGLIPTIEDAIKGAPSSIQGQLNTLFADYKNQLAAAEAQFDAINTDLPQITPANFDSNPTGFEATLANLRGDENVAAQDLRSAAKDLHQMVQLAKAH